MLVDWSQARFFAARCAALASARYAAPATATASGGTNWKPGCARDSGAATATATLKAPAMQAASRRGGGSAGRVVYCHLTCAAAEQSYGCW